MAGFAARVLDGLGPAFRARAGDVVEVLAEALTAPLDEVDTLARPAAADRPWATVFDLEHTSQPAWIGGIVGTRLPGGLSVEEQRAYVRDRAAWRRGRLDALAAAIQAVLGGDHRVGFLERLGADAWTIAILVHADDAVGATEAQIRAAAATQKPVGLLIADVELVADVDEETVTWWRPPGTYLRYARTSELAPTYADRTAMFATYRDSRDYNPSEDS
ncbi:hypothetical protein [Nocardioides sp. SR21]|uniref:hypothetical protein n=1 Tax=Nocardioides sp. SR21 TaxID=2919501 RepID=UPI001FA9B573|nr:hypothetical protein [Nocardioides sp. SR21]